MKRGILSISLCIILLLLCQTVVYAKTDITMLVDPLRAESGTNIIISGATASEAWVSIKGLDEDGNIVYFNAIKADASGTYNDVFEKPDMSPGTLRIIAGSGVNVISAEVEIFRKSGGGGGGGRSSEAAVNSTSGSANVTPSLGGKVGLGSSAVVTIPVGALSGISPVEVTVAKESSPPTVPADFTLLGNVYRFMVGSSSSYQFNKPVSLTFTFDPTLVPTGSSPEVYFYDKLESQWVNWGGEVSDRTIKVTVDHFAIFAVLARNKSEVQFPVVKPVDLNDIAGHWAESSILKLISTGIIMGYPDESFKPDADISRAEFACVLVNAFKLTPKNGKVFNDTNRHWARDYIATAAACGIVNGYDSHTFGPNHRITREQMAVMVIKAMKLAGDSSNTTFADNQDISSWAKDAVATSVKAGIIKGYPDNSFKPQGNTTRAEAAIVILNSSK